MKLYAGIDLHSSNNYPAILRSDEKRVFGKRLPNCVETIRSTLKAYRKRLCGIAVESTYNWYWLVDGLQDDGYKMHLANPSAIQKYEGMLRDQTQFDLKRSFNERFGYGGEPANGLAEKAARLDWKSP